MNREEILKAAQEQSPKEGEFENRVQTKGAILGAGVAIIVAAIMFYVEYLVFHRFDYGKPAIILLISFVSDLHDGVKLKSKKKVIIGIITAVLFVLCMIMYIGALFK